MTQIRFFLVVGVIGVACGCQTTEPVGGKAFLTGKEILAGWQASYGDIEPLRVAYSSSLVKPDPEAKYVKHAHVRRLQHGDRYHIQYSMAEDGFARPESMMEHAFDGELTREYWGNQRDGSIQRGFTSRDVETKNTVDELLLRHRLRVGKHARFLPWFQHITTARVPAAPDPELSVAPELEVVAGQPCHRLDIGIPDAIVSDSVWVAHKCGMMPMRYKRLVRGVVTMEMEVKEVASVKTRGGELWYPVRAVKASGKVGKRAEYVMHVTQFVPHVEASDGDFAFEFPEGTRVVDRVKGTQYVVGSGHKRPLTPGR
jgi:hypothetical protein